MDLYQEAAEGLVTHCVIGVTTVFGIRNSLLQYKEPSMEQLNYPTVSTQAHRLCCIPQKEWCVAVKYSVFDE